MGSDWKEVGLNDLGEVARGKSKHRPRYAVHLYGGKYPFIQTGDIKASGGLVTTHTQTYSEAGVAQSRLWPVNTMCITIAANIAETGILTYPACFPDSVIGFVADENKCDVRFIEYRFRYLKVQLQREAIGSVQDNINLATFKRLKFSIPELLEQKRIADILYTLDSKIHLNQQTNQTLEQMAQTLFKSWFVDFDPVFDNALLKAGVTTQEPHNNAEDQQLLASFPEALRSKAKQRLDVLRSCIPTQEHGNEAFPSEFEFNEQLGWIPKGWVVSELSELINIKHGFAYKGEFFSDEKTENILLTPGNVNVGGGFKSAKYKYYNGPIVNEYIFKEGDMYVNMTDLSKASDTLGYPAIVPQIHGITFHHNQRLGKVIYKENKSAKKEFIYQLLCSHKSRNNVLGSATGTTVKHTSPTKILSLSICHSGGNVESIFESYAKALYEKSAANNLSNIALTKLRDTLLPKLISGELQIPDTKLSASSFPNNA